MLRLAAAALAAAFVPVAAGAATMTFDYIQEVAPFGTNEYSEDGIHLVATGDIGDVVDLGNRANGGLILAVYGSRDLARSVSLTMDSAFDAISFDLIADRSRLLKCTIEEPTACDWFPYLNVGLQGYRDGMLVAETRFSMDDFPAGVAAEFVFGSAFRNLTELVIANLPPLDLVAPDGYRIKYDSPAAFYWIDNVALAPVPLPAGLPLLASALLGIGLLRKRRR